MGDWGRWARPRRAFSPNSRRPPPRPRRRGPGSRSLRSSTPTRPTGCRGCCPRSGRGTTVSRSSPPRSFARSPTSTPTGRWRCRDSEIVGAALGFLGGDCPRHLPAQLHRRRQGGAARQQRRLRPQATSAGLDPRPRAQPDHVDVRPAGPPQRLLQPRQARRHGSRLPSGLLRHDAGRRQRRRLERSHPHRVEPRLAACDRCQRAQRPRPVDVATFDKRRTAVRLSVGAGRTPEVGPIGPPSSWSRSPTTSSPSATPTRASPAGGGWRSARRSAPPSRRAPTPTGSPATAGTSSAGPWTTSSLLPWPHG